MRSLAATLILVLVLVGCERPPVSVVGTWQAFLGEGKAAKLYFGKPEPTEIEFFEDGTYTLHLMWGTRSLAQTRGSYQVEGHTVELSPSENLDGDTWLGRARAPLSPNGRELTVPLPRSARVPEVTFYKVRTF